MAKTAFSDEFVPPTMLLDIVDPRISSNRGSRKTWIIMLVSISELLARILLAKVLARILYLGQYPLKMMPNLTRNIISERSSCDGRKNMNEYFRAFIFRVVTAGSHLSSNVTISWIIPGSLCWCQFQIPNRGFLTQIVSDDFACEGPSKDTPLEPKPLEDDARSDQDYRIRALEL
ncbi:hypothetical protein Q1695_013514 [Nippostrongylus brasiliensis]|nr:hypothetical protein Q1695_013514 [Nippostrongylus brasiliensis]